MPRFVLCGERVIYIGILLLRSSVWVIGNASILEYDLHGSQVLTSTYLVS